MNNMETEIAEYINQLTPLERKVNDIAHSHMGTSFDIIKSNGFIKWITTSKSSTFTTMSSSSAMGSSV